MDYKKYNDYELIYMIGENDESSKNILLKKYSPIIFSVTSKYYRKYKKCGYQYEDFYQEAVVAFHKAISTYDADKDSLFYTYCVICMNRSLLSFVRKISNDKRNKPFEDYVELEEISYFVEDPKSNIDLIIKEKEIDNIVKNIIYNSPIDISPIIELKYNGFTYKEIGILLDIPASTVEYKVRRIRNLLRNKIRQY